MAPALEGNPHWEWKLSRVQSFTYPGVLRSREVCEKVSRVARSATLPGLPGFFRLLDLETYSKVGDWKAFQRESVGMHGP